MSTPRHEDTCKFCKGDAEGVAAPLEPSRQEFAANLEHEWLDQQSILDFRNWLIEKLWTAAAVSKNLQEELAALRIRWNFALKWEDEALRECRRLEKEIAALRETK